MDKTTMISRITAANPSLSPDFLNSLNDQQLAMLMDSIQGGAADATVNTATPAATPPAATGVATPADQDPAKMMADCGDDPVKMKAAATKMMNDAAAALARVRRTEAMLAETTNRAVNEHGKTVDHRIKCFMDDNAKRIPPYMRDVIESQLRNADSVDVGVRKFADGSSKNGTALDVLMNKIEQFPEDAKFARKFSDGSVKNGTLVGTSDVNQRRVEKMMLGSETGRAIVMQERAAAGKK